MGECFFWYRPTRVVPDQRPLNGHCCSGREVAVTGSPRLSWIKAVQTVVSGQYCDSSIILISANLVLHRTIERIHVGKKYGDIPRGIFVIRGENVVLLGEVVSDVCC